MTSVEQIGPPGVVQRPGRGVWRAYAEIVHREVMGVPVVVEVRPLRPVEQLQDWGRFAGRGRRLRRRLVRSGGGRDG